MIVGTTYATDPNLESGIKQVWTDVAPSTLPGEFTGDGVVDATDEAKFLAFLQMEDGSLPEPNSGFVAIAAGNHHSLALRPDGSVAAWGLNANGQLDVPEPNSNFVAIAGGAEHSVGLRADGTIAVWTCPSPGIIRGQCVNRPNPNSGFVDIAAAGRHALGLKEDGSIVGWGSGCNGCSVIPAPNSGFVAVAAGGSHHMMGLRADGSIGRKTGQD